MKENKCLESGGKWAKDILFPKKTYRCLPKKTTGTGKDVQHH